MEAPTPKPTFAAVTRLNPTQQVHNQLLAAITDGDYAPGAALPSERELCEAFGVSRVSVREALAGLAATGLIDIQQGRGAFVRPRMGTEYAAPFAQYLQLHRDELSELLQVRGALDGLAAEEAALGAQEEDRAAMTAACQEFATAADAGASPEELTRLDVAFHQSIAAAGRGTLLPGLLGDLNALLVESRHILFARTGQPHRSVADHGAILDAVLAGAAQAARTLATEHVAKMGRWVSDFGAAGERAAAAEPAP